MKVFDDAFSQNEIKNLREWLFAQNLLPGWRAHASAPGTFWHKNFVLPGTRAHHYDSKACNPELTFERLISGESPLSKVARDIKQRFFATSEITRVWANVQSFGDESAFHRDFPLEYSNSARSVILYAVDDWDKDWGGDLVVLNDDGEIKSAALVKPARLVVLDGCLRHAVRPISRYCNSLRVAVVFGTEVLT
jgi:hypothetical protein